MKYINSLLIRWHLWRMESTFGYDRDKCGYHADRIMQLCRDREIT